MKARVLVRLKNEVSDPAGAAIREALGTLHYDAVAKVRVGKVFDLELREDDPDRAKAELDRIARDVLSNPVIEDYTFEIVEL
jgi:phosphoribosylformylglycinamidine synthase subunit PurS